MYICHICIYDAKGEKTTMISIRKKRTNWYIVSFSICICVVLLSCVITVNVLKNQPKYKKQEEIQIANNLPINESDEGKQTISFAKYSGDVSENVTSNAQVNLNSIEESKQKLNNEKRMTAVKRYNGSEEIIVLVHNVVYEAGPFVSPFGAGEEYVYNLTDEQIILLAKIIFAEAGNQSLRGKVAVGAVVLNRFVSEETDFGDTIEEVILGGSFTSLLEMTDEQMEQCLEAAELACKGWDPTRIKFEEGALYFYSKGANLSGRKEVPKYVIEGHTFTYLYGK